jgi:hypothetical protein
MDRGCQIATENLREIATTEISDEKHCQKAIRYLAIILLAMKSDVYWIKQLLIILLISVLSLGGYCISV